MRWVLQGNLIFAWILRTSWPKWKFWGKIGEGVVRYWPLTNSFFLLGVLTSVPTLVKIDEEMRPWECSQTDRYTDTLTDANRFYNLSHAICYSYGTDNNAGEWLRLILSINCFIRIRSIRHLGYVPKSSTLPLISFVRVSLNSRIIYHVENRTDCYLYLIVCRNKSVSIQIIASIQLYMRTSPYNTCAFNINVKIPTQWTIKNVTFYFSL